VLHISFHCAIAFDSPIFFHLIGFPVAPIVTAGPLFLKAGFVFPALLPAV
jgi:hypothetical protein